MWKNRYISDAVIRRLPHYRRVLKDLMKSDIRDVSSEKLSAITGATASQIRQDLRNFGTFGSSGYGYHVKRLCKQIEMILGLNQTYQMIVIGAGHMAQAIARNQELLRSGFQICAIFDCNPRLQGLSINNIKVIDYCGLEEYLKGHHIDICVITETDGIMGNAAELIQRSGAGGIWNLTAHELQPVMGFPAENMHLEDSLQKLTYSMKHCSMSQELKLEKQYPSVSRINKPTEKLLYKVEAK